MFSTEEGGFRLDIRRLFPLRVQRAWPERWEKPHPWRHPAGLRWTRPLAALRRRWSGAVTAAGDLRCTRGRGAVLGAVWDVCLWTGGF